MDIFYHGKHTVLKAVLITVTRQSNTSSFMSFSIIGGHTIIVDSICGLHAVNYTQDFLCSCGN